MGSASPFWFGGERRSKAGAAGEQCRVKGSPMVLSPLPRAFPSPTFPRSFGAAGGVPSAGASTVLGTRLPLELWKPIPGTHCLWNCGNPSLASWKDPRAMLMAQAHGREQTHTEGKCLALPLLQTNSISQAGMKCWDKSQQPREQAQLPGHGSWAGTSSLSQVVTPRGGFVPSPPGLPAFHGTLPGNFQ